MEPYILAARRQLSVMHPVMKALHPHFKDTMQADAFARKSLFNAGGKIEAIYNAGPYAMRFSSLVYGRWWRFDRQGLPADLISRCQPRTQQCVQHELCYSFSNVK